MPTGNAPTSNRFQRHKLNPYKILAIFLYSRVAPVIRLGGGNLAVKVGPLARLLHVSVGRTVEYLHWLEKHKYINKLSKLESGEYTLEVATPSVFE
jgi:hypothetical protein